MLHLIIMHGKLSCIRLECTLLWGNRILICSSLSSKKSFTIFSKKSFSVYWDYTQVTKCTAFDCLPKSKRKVSPQNPTKINKKYQENLNFYKKGHQKKYICMCIWS